MNKNEIREVLDEIGAGLCRTAVDGVSQLDNHTFFFGLYGIGAWHGLLVTTKKNALRFHLLFVNPHREHVRKSPAAALLHKHCARAKIVSVAMRDGVIELRLLRDAERRLLVYLDSGDIQLLEGDSELFRLHRQYEHETLQDTEAVLSYSREPVRDRRSFNEAGDAALNRRLSESFVRQYNSALSRRVESVLRGEQKKLARLKDKLLKELEETRNREDYRLKGDLLKYNLSLVKRGERSVWIDGFDGNPVLVELDPMLGPRENMERYFMQYRKLKRRGDFIDRKIEFEKKRASALHELLQRVRVGEAVTITRPPLDFVEGMDTELLGRGLQGRVRRIFFPERVNRRDDAKQQKFLRFHSKTGKTILVGRNARENDDLTLRTARGNDIWFHVETGTGSHVILRYDSGRDIQDADIVDAAMLALHFSNFRNDKSGDVVYTYRKYIRKPKDKPAGFVTYHHHKTKHIRTDQQVLGRLLDSKPQGLRS
jgi:predicted ribosome quality control (RQC) complex YloA/Tae2 family protein